MPATQEYKTARNTRVNSLKPDPLKHSHQLIPSANVPHALRSTILELRDSAELTFLPSTVEDSHLLDTGHSVPDHGSLVPIMTTLHGPADTQPLSPEPASPVLPQTTLEGVGEDGGPADTTQTQLDIASSFIRQDPTQDALETQIFSPTQPQQPLSQYSESKRFKTPATAGFKRRASTAFADTPAPIRNPILDAQRSGPGQTMGLSQAFAATQAATSPFVNGMTDQLRSDRPSPTVAVAISEHAISSPLLQRITPNEETVAESIARQPRANAPQDYSRGLPPIVEQELSQASTHEGFDSLPSPLARRRRQQQRQRRLQSELDAVSSSPPKRMADSNGEQAGNRRVSSETSANIPSSPPVGPHEPVQETFESALLTESNQITTMSSGARADQQYFDSNPISSNSLSNAILMVPDTARRAKVFQETLPSQKSPSRKTSQFQKGAVQSSDDLGAVLHSSSLNVPAESTTRSVIRTARNLRMLDRVSASPERELDTTQLLATAPAYPDVPSSGVLMVPTEPPLLITTMSAVQQQERPIAPRLPRDIYDAGPNPVSPPTFVNGASMVQTKPVYEDWSSQPVLHPSRKRKATSPQPEEDIVASSPIVDDGQRPLGSSPVQAQVQPDVFRVDSGLEILTPPRKARRSMWDLEESPGELGVSSARSTNKSVAPARKRLPNLTDTAVGQGSLSEGRSIRTIPESTHQHDQTDLVSDATTAASEYTTNGPSAIAPDMVFACYFDRTRAYYPAVCLSVAADGKVFTIQWPGYDSEEQIDCFGVCALELRAGDTVKVASSAFGKTPWTIQSLTRKPELKTKTNITDVHGHTHVIVVPKSGPGGRVAAAKSRTAAIEDVYLDSNMWTRMQARKPLSKPEIAHTISRYSTPPIRHSSPVTPASRNHRSFRESSLQPSDKGGILMSMGFVLSIENEKMRDEVSDRIKECGGSVLKNSFQELFDEDMQIKEQFCRLGFTALLADRHSRKEKYMQALALNLPCLSRKWLDACIKNGSAVDWLDFLLPAGESAALEGAVRSRVLHFGEKQHASLQAAVAERVRLFDRGRFVFVAGKGKSELRRKTHLVLCKMTGAVHPQIVPDLAAAETSILKGEPGTIWLFVDDKDAQPARSMAKTIVDRVSRRRNADSVNITVIDGETLMQSLILGRLFSSAD